MQPRLLEQIPRYGWDLVSLYDDVELTDIDPNGAPVRRPPGMSRVSVVATVEVADVGGTGEFEIILEGSNTGDGTNSAEWYTLATLGEATYFVAPQVNPTETRVLGGTDPQITTPVGLGITLFGNGDVSVGRYQFLRVRANTVSLTPTYTITVNMDGTAGDAESFTRVLNAVSAAGESNEVITDYVRRPPGTRWLTATSIARSILVDPPAGSGFWSIIEGAINQADAAAGNFVALFPAESAGAIFYNVGDATSYQVNNAPAMDMGAYNLFRVHIYNFPAIPPDPTSSYTIETTLSFDDNDWLQGEIGFADLAPDVRTTFVNVLWGEPEPQGTGGATPTQRILSGQMVDGNGNPISSSPFLGQTAAQAVVVVSDREGGAQFSLHPTATAVGADAVSPALSPAVQYPIRCDSDGSFTLIIDSNGAPTTAYVSCISYVPQPPRKFVVVSSQVVAVVLT